MGYYCTVPQCTSLAGKTKNVKFHRFPGDKAMANKWNLILKRGKPITIYSKVCSLHFTQADYKVTAMGQWKTLSKDAVPSQNLPKLNPDGTVMVIRKSRTVKYKEERKENCGSEKPEKWCLSSQPTMAATNTADVCLPKTESPDSNNLYRFQTVNAIESGVPIQPGDGSMPVVRPKKQDAFMQTDPIQSEEDDTQANNSYSECSEKSFGSDQLDYSVHVRYEEADGYDVVEFDLPKDYTKANAEIQPANMDFKEPIYTIERKSLKAYENFGTLYLKPITEDDYLKLPEMYAYSDKPDYPNRNDNYIEYTTGYPDSAEVLRNQQHNIQLLQEPQRIAESQNIFSENHIKQEVDFSSEDDKFIYEQPNDQIAETNNLNEYNDNERRTGQQRLLENLQLQLKQELDVNNGCENVMQPQSSPYYQANGQNTTDTPTYYEQVWRPGPELLIAKQNALAAHTQLWQNTMKRPFFYSESSPYTGQQEALEYHGEMGDIPKIEK